MLARIEGDDSLAEDFGGRRILRNALIGASHLSISSRMAASEMARSNMYIIMARRLSFAMRGGGMAIR